jgi:hypothetical protein
VHFCAEHAGPAFLTLLDQCCGRDVADPGYALLRERNPETCST